MEKFLNREMSQLKTPGLRRLMVRLRLPYVKAAAGEKAAGLIQFGPPILIRSPEVAGERPVALGRWLAPNRYALFWLELCEICSGKPDEMTFTTFSCHPPTARSAARLALPRNRLPWPNGKS